VVFITDGAVGNEAALFQQIRQQLGDRRLFTVGIGSAPNLHFMREAARWGRGTYTAVAGPSDLEAPLQRLFATMAAPVLTHLVADWPTPAAEAYPGRPGDLFEGEPLVQVVRGVPPRGRLLLSGSGPGGEPWQVAVDLSQAVPGVGLHRLWARARIDSLLDQARIEGVAPDQAAIVQLARAHRLASPYTSFVAVDRTPVRAPQQPLLRTAVPTLVPAGSSAGMLRYPQTATVAPLLIALGTLGLMFAVALVLLQRRVGA
jgi:Ca-activated chloride channel family protein